MSKQFRKLPVLALSACSIPVMLAFAGVGTRSTGAQAPSVTTEDVSFTNNHHLGIQADPLVNAGVSAGVNAGVRAEVNAGIDVAAPAACITYDAADSLNTDDYRGVSWMCVSPDGDHFWVANGNDSSISTYRFKDDHGSTESVNYELISSSDELSDQTLFADSQSADHVDLQLSDDGQWLYQLFEQSGTVAVYEVEGHKLELVETLTA